MGKISLADLERLRPSRGEHPDGAHEWIELITTLVQWRHRFDIDIDGPPSAVEVGASDIELDS